MMASDFGATIPYVQWVAFGYILATGSLLLPAGSLSDMIGRKVVYISGYLVFIVGAALAGMSSELMAVIAFRFVQGTGAAMIQANGMAILTTTFPARDRGKVIGLFMTMVGMGAIMGPIISGFVVDTFGWRAVFLLGVPLGLISISTASIVLIRDTPRVTRTETAVVRFRLDWGVSFGERTRRVPAGYDHSLSHRLGFSRGDWGTGALHQPAGRFRLLGAQRLDAYARSRAIQAKDIRAGRLGQFLRIPGRQRRIQHDAVLPSGRSRPVTASGRSVHHARRDWIRALRPCPGLCRTASGRDESNSSVWRC